MYQTYEKYSTGLGVRFSRGLLFTLLKILLIAFLLYLVLSYIFIVSFRVDSNSMYPTLAEKNRILVSPLVFGAKLPFLPTRLRGLKQPERGDLVVVYSPSYTEPSFPVAFLEPVIRFLTLQRGSIVFDLTGKRIPRHLIKRIIGLPGDTIKMSDFAVFIKPMGSTVFYDEQELISAVYRVNTVLEAEGWKKDFPFNGNLEPTTLKENEYFILGDNRPDSSDSRSWGPLPADRLLGKVLLKYWPLNEFVRF